MTASRRYFWGNTLRQALAKAAQLHGLAPEALAWKSVEKRHGFVKHPRRVLIEVDPAAPRSSSAALTDVLLRDVAQRTPPAPGVPTPSSPGAAPEAAAARVPEHRPREEGRRSPVRRDRGSRRPPFAGEPIAPPDEEAALAASVAVGRLMRFAGLDLAGRAVPAEERLEISLEGPDVERLRGLGLAFLDDVAHLLPRMIRSLSGRQVLCRVDGAGLRGERDESLRRLALEAAARVVATGEPELLEPLPASERRIVHVALADDPRVRTESLGSGMEKPLRIERVESADDAPPPAPRN